MAGFSAHVAHQRLFISALNCLEPDKDKMATRLSLQCILLACLGRLTWAQPASVDLPYTLEHPYEQQANGNGLAIEKPNMIIFMPDQLRYDSVGIFGSDVSLPFSTRTTNQLGGFDT